MVKFRTVSDSNWACGTIGAGLAILFGLLLFSTHIGWDLTHLSYDIPFGLENPSRPEEAIVIYLDEESHTHLNQPLDKPWDRAIHARLLDFLKEQGASPVVFDIVFSKPSTNRPEGDAKLIEAVRNHGQVVLAADVWMENLHMRWQPELPFAELKQAAAGWGNVRWQPDPDGGVRVQFANLNNVHTVPFFPTLAWTAARTAGIRDLPENDEFWLNYYGPFGQIKHISYYVAADPVSQADLKKENPDFFRGKAVFIGSGMGAGNTGDAKDTFATPYTLWGKGPVPGVELHATAYLNLLRGEWIKRLPWGVELALLVLTGALFGLGLARFNHLKAVAIAGVSCAVVAAAGVLVMWKLRVWFNWMLIAGLQIPVALVWAISYNALNAFIAKRVLQRSLALYLSPARARQILRNPGLLVPGAEQKEVSLLFTDIADYSTISQMASPEELVMVLNDYFQTALASIHKTDGTVVKFIGDAIFAMWNAPDDQPDHQNLACQAVAQLHADLAKYNLLLKERHAAGETKMAFTFRTRIGLHSGQTFVGNFGSSQRFDYTATGDGVNLASRLEGLNKYLGTDVLMSGEFHAAIAARYVTRHVGNFKPKGFIKHLPVYELIGLLEVAEETRAWREAFAAALAKFAEGQFAAAAEGFTATNRLRNEQFLKTHPGEKEIEDGPSKFYLKQIERFLAEPPPPGWTGEVEPEGK
jgi:adenylate cyclase